MKSFFSGDWGTSTFRLRLVDANTASVLSEVKTDHGIAAAYKSWKQVNRPEDERISFYQAYLFEQLKKITNTFIDASYNAPLILSGMVSSSIGMKQLSYKQLPFKCDGSDLVVETIAEKDQHHKIIMISGVSSEVDVLRGEETILAGCNIPTNDTGHLLIFPGTHSKHITVKNAEAINIATYMTGELFDLLSKNSILAASVKKSDPEDNDNYKFFIEGVIKGMGSNIMNSIFHVRTNELFSKATPEENYHYLSGILIGHELKDVAENKPVSITLVCSESLKKNYLQALEVAWPGVLVNYKNADEALINGQRMILQQQGYL